MDNSNKSPQSIFVWGLPTVDHFYVGDGGKRPKVSAFASLPRPRDRARDVLQSKMAGGAALTTALIEQLLPTDCGSVYGMRLKAGPASEGWSDRLFPDDRLRQASEQRHIECVESEVPHRWAICQSYDPPASEVQDILATGKPAQDRLHGVGPSEKRVRQESWGEIEREPRKPNDESEPWNARLGAPQVQKRRECFGSGATLLVIDDPGPFLAETWYPKAGDLVGTIGRFVLGESRTQDGEKATVPSEPKRADQVSESEPEPEPNFQHILLKASHFEGPERNGLGKKWSYLIEAFGQAPPRRPGGKEIDVTLLVSIRDLRARDATIGLPLSWEQVFTDVVRAIHSRSSGFMVDNQLAFHQVIVTVGLGGAVLVRRKPAGGPNVCELVFDPSHQEGDFEFKHPGEVTGTGTCVLAALATAWAECRDDVDWAEATRTGLAMAQRLHQTGYIKGGTAGHKVLNFPFEMLEDVYFQYELPLQVKAKHERQDSLEWDKAEREDLRPSESDKSSTSQAAGDQPAGAGNGSSPLDAGGSAVHQETKKKDGGAEIELYKRPWLQIYRDTRDRLDSRDRWSILEELYFGRELGNRTGQTADGSLFDLACEIAQKGPDKALRTAPVEHIGQWQSADREEIEGIRAVLNAIHEHLQVSQGRDKPMAVAVFGAPGAGKSFVVTQIPEHIKVHLKEVKLELLTFNLTQFKGPEDLPGAFHQIRDVHLKGSVPLVFWDEFDADLPNAPFGWLKYFLAPLQDGQFVDAQGVHPIGGGIHVFGGGRFATFEEFDEESRKKNEGRGGPEKLPDFRSRLSAHMVTRG